ncbi:Predicted PurR-regulated permease PerM [Methylobacillus rhizosphaerae]|uniref:Predicted PurR-regulated permease PerM n=1 Tax=Methylobacillus rhizosphaerae TaxID=551994 RepID=A0A239AV08_9PROT|nr:AI-2E family transporter [Methylobacillus rhizosphaerae]SNR99410.1 Predicted PurR-regulated permease PerM [Methylobacillus rhizosphaerae]
MNSADFHNKSFIFLLLLVSAGLIIILLPFYGAVFWGVILSILFTPLYRRLLVKTKQRRNLAAFGTLSVCFVIVIVPVILIASSLVHEGTTLFQKVKSGQINPALYTQQILNAAPAPVHKVLERTGFADVSNFQEKLSQIATQASQLLATRALSIGQNTFEFVVGFGVMLYLMFFLLRDGSALSMRVKQAIPLSAEHKRHLFNKFTTVIRATVKGNILVAITQGALGGLIFWILGIQAALLWATIMAFLSLLPAVGASLIWAPVAIYFLATGATWQGITLIAFGVFVIGLVDNILRPILVGKDTKLPDYVVLISTLGGMAVFGLNGFVIGPLIAALFLTMWDIFGSSRPTDRN